jgi:hypothetical protein
MESNSNENSQIPPKQEVEEEKVGPKAPTELIPAGPPAFNIWVKFKEVCKKVNSKSKKYISEGYVPKKVFDSSTSVTDDIYYRYDDKLAPLKVTFNPPV